MSWQQVHAAIVAVGEPATADQVDLLHSLLARFVERNEDSRTLPDIDTAGLDRLDPLAALLERQDVANSSLPVRLLVLKTLKIASRRQDVRQLCSQRVLEVLTPLLEGSNQPAADESKHQQQRQYLKSALVSEAANTLGNLCYEPANCTALTRVGGVQSLLQLLSDEGSGKEAQANAAGALQTLSFQPDARAAVVKAGGAVKLLRILEILSTARVPADSIEVRLHQRLAGALQNVSSSADGIAAIRQHDGIATIVGLLYSPHPGVAAAAAGILHNMSREAVARCEMHRHPHMLSCLTALLTGADTQVQGTGCT